MKIRLGYACISNTLNITSSSTLTYKNYLKLNKKANTKLDKIIKSNFKNLKEILKYNIKNEIYFYRMTSKLIPLGTHPDVDYEIFNRYEKEFREGLSDLLLFYDSKKDILKANIESVRNKRRVENMAGSCARKMLEEYCITGDFTLPSDSEVLAEVF